MKDSIFLETFLLSNTSMNVVLDMFFLTLSNIDMLFAEKKHIWRLYLPVEALPTTKRVYIISYKKFTIVALDPTKKTFVIHIAFLFLSSKITIHLAWKTQIALLIAEEVAITAKYSNYANVFSK